MWLSVDTFQILSFAEFIVNTCLYETLSPTFFINVFYLVSFFISVCVDNVIERKSVSQTCIRRLLLGPLKSGCLGQAVIL